MGSAGDHRGPPMPHRRTTPHGTGGRRRYRVLAPVYDVLSGEWPIYRAGRRAGVDVLHLRPGETVLDVGCGTGLTLPLLQRSIGASGRVVGLDASAQMLRQARRRADRNGWSNVRLVHADATSVDPRELTDALGEDNHPRRADAVIFVYTLSLMTDWRAAWQRAVAAARPGARVAVVDMRMPTGRARWFLPSLPLAGLACALGGADPGAHPWTVVEAEADTVEGRSMWGGHVQVRGGTTRPAAADAEKVER